MKSRRRVWLTCLACGFMWAASVHAQYPTKPVRFILPFPPGGGTDTLARAIGNRLSEALGQRLVIENRPGGGANIGAADAAQSEPDGYTLFMMTTTHTINATLYKDPGYNLVRDFAPVTGLATNAMVVVVHPSLPVKSIKQLIALAKAHPGDIPYSSSGTGSITQLAVELFKDKTGVKMLHVPYRGGGPAIIALISGEAAVGFASTPSCIHQIKASQLRGLAVTTSKRSPFLPQLPTVAEAGVPGYQSEIWLAMLVPTGTPKEIIARVRADTIKAFQFADVKARLKATGLVPMTSTPEQLAALIRSEIERWGKVVKRLGLRVD